MPTVIGLSNVPAWTTLVGNMMQRRFGIDGEYRGYAQLRKEWIAKFANVRTADVLRQEKDVVWESIRLYQTGTRTSTGPPDGDAGRPIPLLMGCVFKLMQRRDPEKWAMRD